MLTKQQIRKQLQVAKDKDQRHCRLPKADSYGNPRIPCGGGYRIRKKSF